MNLLLRVREKIPLGVKQEIRNIQRNFIDFCDKNKPRVIFEKQNYPLRLSLIQPILQGAFYENKVKNIRRGCDILNTSAINKKQVWSFWHHVGRPSTRNGFYQGRSLINGRISTQIGGGLCQLTSIIYHLSLIAGLEVIERHTHSTDIYDENTRFTPLGADATVVWGFKDLRIRNPYDFSVYFIMYIKESNLIIELHSEQNIQSKEVMFTRVAISKGVNKVNTIIDGVTINSHDYTYKPI
jgi:vancomycin resistance protein VanW